MCLHNNYVIVIRWVCGIGLIYMLKPEDIGIYIKPLMYPIVVVFHYGIVKPLIKHLYLWLLVVKDFVRKLSDSEQLCNYVITINKSKIFNTGALYM